MQKSDLVKGCSITVEHLSECIKEELSDLSTAMFDEVVYGPGDEYEPVCDQARLSKLTMTVLKLAAELNTFILDGMVKR